MFQKFKKIHFVGIGGIGVSALARMMLKLKIKVSGSDLMSGENIKLLKKAGAKIRIGHHAKNLPIDCEAVIYSPAIKNDNLELVFAQQKKIPIYSYPEVLGLLSSKKYTVAISGTHGKTSTTAMIGKILIDAKKSPTLIVGGILPEYKGNFVYGQSKYFVVEACEYKESFLNLNSNILIITNVDNDHLDYYKNFSNIKKAFVKLISKVSEDGYVVCNPNNLVIKDILKNFKKKYNRKINIIDYTKEVSNFKLKIPGKHNVLNAQAAISATKIIKIPKQKIINTLKKYTGVLRRFEFKGKTKNGALIYDDYAHHPTEILATIKAAQEKFKNSKILVVFQPHLYSRTKILLKNLAKSLNLADEIIVTDIYAAREKNTGLIHAKDLVWVINLKEKKAKYIKNFLTIENYLKKHTYNTDVILTVGAGDIYKIGEKLC